MAPEEEVIDPSSLTKFRKIRLKDINLLDMLINKTVAIALEKGIIKSKSIIVDANSAIKKFLIPYGWVVCSHAMLILSFSIKYNIRSAEFSADFFILALAICILSVS